MASSPELEDALFDEYAARLSALGDAQIRALVHSKVSAASERRAFEAASAGVSRQTLIFVASGYLVRHKLNAAAPASDPFPIWFRGDPAT